MTKKKSIITKLFVALVALTLISCCFLGSTFARYTSGSNGSASVQLAKWDVSITGSGVGSTDYTFNNGVLSPDDTGYTSATAVKNELFDTPVLIATITNNSEVDAKITIDIATSYVGSDSKVIGATTDPSATKFDTSGYSWQAEAVSGDGASEAQVKAALSINFYYGDAGTWDEGFASQKITTDTGYTTTLSAKASAGDANAIYIYANVTWTTDYATYDDGNGAVADAIDTWIGMKVESLKATLTYTAVQASQKPAGN